MDILGIHLNQAELWLLAIIGACIALLVPHRLAVSREQQAAYRVASVKFRSAILNELSGLYPIPTGWPQIEMAIIDILKSKFSTLQAAVTEFANVLPWYRRYFFYQAWRRYRLGKDDIEYWQYLPSSGTGYEKGRYIEHDDRFTYKTNFKLNIARILKYAK